MPQSARVSEHTRLLSVPGRQLQGALESEPMAWDSLLSPPSPGCFLVETASRWRGGDAGRSVRSALPGPLLARASDLSPRPVGQSQLSADVGKQWGGWTGRLSGPALCPENLLCHGSSARQAQPSGHFQCPQQDRASGPSSLHLDQLTDPGGHLLPTGPRNRSLQYKCKCAAVGAGRSSLCCRLGTGADTGRER